jgi:sialate O-acetylesterase
MTFNDLDLQVEKGFIDLGGHWYDKTEDSISFSTQAINDINWSVDRFMYYALIRNSNKVTWMRKHFIAPEHIPADTLILRLSLLDIQGQVYINGVKIADSCFIFSRSVCCYLPSKYLLKGKSNLIAVRANSMLPNPDNALDKCKDEIVILLKPTVSLKGIWRFSAGDNEGWRNRNFNCSFFKNLIVPMFWDYQGYKSYLGIGWYRKSFQVPPVMRHQKLLFVAGKVDDYCEVYINGTKIGGHIVKGLNITNTDWDKYGIYPFDGNLLDETNIVAIRVVNNQGRGGMYQGPVGIISMEDYLSQMTGEKK